MPQDTTSLPSGAGTTTNSSSTNTDLPPRILGGDRQWAASGQDVTPASETTRFQQDEHETGYRSSGRAIVVSEQAQSRPKTSLVVGAALAGAVVGGALPFMLSGRSSGGDRRRDTARTEETVTINRPARTLYDFWRDFENLPQFMDNIKSVSKLSDKRSHWVIKAPAGTSVEFDSRVVDEIPGKLIAWESEYGASVPNRGRVEFNETSPGVTLVRAVISYDPPAGAVGRAVAKLFQREPSTQAKQDLTRFKELMENERVR